MLMLILLTMVHYHNAIYFNTSHVNVNQRKRTEVNGRVIHFNTSHVNVNRAVIGINRQRVIFQYISC